MKAKKTGFVIRGMYSDLVEYEYRGVKYCVEYANSMTYCCTSPKAQHMDAQARIDREIDTPKKPYRYEDTAEYGLDMFFNTFN